jgi:hypothetical protein
MVYYFTVIYKLPTEDAVKKDGKSHDDEMIMNMIMIVWQYAGV